MGYIGPVILESTTSLIQSLNTEMMWVPTFLAYRTTIALVPNLLWDMLWIFNKLIEIYTYILLFLNIYLAMKSRKSNRKLTKNRKHLQTSIFLV